jgi:hypothetical protein
MGVVNTTYTFSGTDTITSAKLNNIIDDTTFTSDAIQGTTLQVVSPGKLAVNALGITSNELSSGAVTQSKLGTNVVGNGPVIFVNSITGTTVPTGGSATATKITLDSENTDTNNNFANSRFTPTVAGYYQINGYANTAGATLALMARIFKNNGPALAGNIANVGTYISTVSGILYCNGSSDYVELFADQGSGSNVTVFGQMSACLIRSA